MFVFRSEAGIKPVARSNIKDFPSSVLFVHFVTADPYPSELSNNLTDEGEN